jgi:PAS domain S-box-containing protein
VKSNRIFLILIALSATLLFAFATISDQSNAIVAGLYLLLLLAIAVLGWPMRAIQTSKNAAGTKSLHPSAAAAPDFAKDLHQRLNQTFIDLPIGVCAIDNTENISLWNHALEKMTGISEAEIVGTLVTKLKEPWLSLLHNFINDEQSHLYKQSFDLNGKKRTVNLHKSLINGAESLNSEYRETLILLEDVSETELLEASLKHSERLASIGRLAAGVAHEIGNPITGIACLAQNIRDEFSDQEIRSMAKQIIEQTNRTSRIVQSLINFAHTGTSTADTEMEIVKIRDCIDEAITLVSLDKKGKTINFEVICDEDISLPTDSQRLLQVLLNLINNSRDASRPDGTIKIQCSRTQAEIHIVVEDESVGIPEAIRDRVFDPFFTTKEAGDGTGLGLSLVYRIVEDLHGIIDIISPTGEKSEGGTRVLLAFPQNNKNLESKAFSSIHEDFLG